MAKINQEEYEVLKELDDKWKWIARDRDDSLYAFEKKPYKHIRTWLWRGNHDFRIITEAGFQFIKWEDEKPYNMAELIEEYEEEVDLKEKMSVVRDRLEEVCGIAMKEVGRVFGGNGLESEETEVKKDLNWFKEQLDDIEMNTPMLSSHDSIWMLDRVNKLLNQLDEPETLSEYWLEPKSIDDEVRLYVCKSDLQALLVSEQKLPVVPTWFDEWWKDVTKGGGNLFHNIERFYDELFSSGTSEMYSYIGSPDNKKKLLNIIINELEYVVEKDQKYILSINITDKASKTNYETFLNKRGIFHSMDNESFNSEEFNWSEEEIKGMENGEILFEHFAVKVEELE